MTVPDIGPRESGSERKWGLPRQAVLWAQAACLVAAALVIYLQVCRGGLLWDDALEITRNPALRTVHGLHAIWFAPSGPDYYPIKTTLQWFQWHLWGADLLGYHLTNLVGHLINGFLVGRLLRRLGLRLAWFGAALFLAHPLAVESVAWIAEFKNVLSLMFLLLSILAFLRFDQNRGGISYVIAVLLFAASMLSKCSVAMLPVCLLLYTWWRKGRVGWADVKLLAPFFGVAAGLGIVAIWFQETRAIGAWRVPYDGLLAHFCAPALAIAFYLEKFLVPVGLAPIYPRWPLNPPSVVDWLPTFGVPLLGAWLWRRRKGAARHFIFGFGFFVLNVLPTLGFVPMSYFVYSRVADHFTYISSIGLAGLTAGAVGWIFHRWRFGAVILSIVIIGALVWDSARYARNFRSEPAFWSYAIAGNPNLPGPHYNLGLYYQSSGLPSAAIEEYRAGLALDPGSPELQTNLGLTLASVGRSAEALPHFQAAARLTPTLAEAQVNLAVALKNARRYPEAIAAFERAIRLNPRLPDVHGDFGAMLVAAGNFRDAVPELERAVAVAPGDEAARMTLAYSLIKLNLIDRAIEQYQLILQATPRDDQVRRALARLFLTTGRLDDAARQYEEVLHAEPDDAESRRVLDSVLRRLGDLKALAEPRAR